ncbi:pyridoxal phosphate-dependent aminotransferase [Pantoea coffeiphila]|uniref:pyridoxal phosphate-dependent aminotransferase n=1 Tax=Pantoea coffeiphila TaxID=1465635 RepID=UPI0019611BD2|nr:aminotransferase class I/II-fold pyridoxal phosphate-dependent enzyme [Pantoea coffeiphila]MBM7343015.1 aspartate aminotransferase [Pantoea coffeiphila]
MSWNAALNDAVTSAAQPSPPGEHPASSHRLSRVAERLDYSDIIKLASYVQQQTSAGKDICDLIIGDFDTHYFPLPAALKRAIHQAYDDGQNDYPPLEGVLPLREAVARLANTHLGCDYDPATEIVVSGGSRPLLYLALLALADPGEKVLYPAPSWNNVYYATLCGAHGIAVETHQENQFLPTAEELAPYLSDARVLSLCSPQNPPGTMFTREALEAICDLAMAENERRRRCQQKPLFIIFDQVYWMLTCQTRQHHHPVELRPELKPYTLIVDGGSKAFAATGVRVGWGMGPADVIDRITLMIEHIGAIAPKAEQLATAALLSDHRRLFDHLDVFKARILQSLQLLHQGVQQLKSAGLPVDSIEPMGGIYLSIQFNVIGRVTPQGTRLDSAAAVSRYLIDEAGFALVPFSFFGMSGQICWFRAAVCAVLPEQIESALPRLRSALAALK